MSSFWNRLYRAAKLDVGLYQEVVEDPKTGGQYVWVVAVYALGAGLGTFGRVDATTVNITLISTFLAWYVWAFFSYFIGTRFLAEPQTPRDRKALMRALGFACAPGWIRLLGLYPGLSLFLLLVASIWMLMAGTLAIKVALNLTSIVRAAGICLLCWIFGWIVQGLLLVTLISAFGTKLM